MKKRISDFIYNLNISLCMHDWKGYFTDNQGRWQDGKAFTGCMKCNTTKSYEKTDSEKADDEYNKNRYAYTQNPHQ